MKTNQSMQTVCGHVDKVGAQTDFTVIFGINTGCMWESWHRSNLN
jgi:hypothetical protein